MPFLKFVRCPLLPVRCSVPYIIFSKHSLFSTSKLSNAKPSDKPREEAEQDRQRRKIAMTHFLLNECGLSESQVSILVSRKLRLFKRTSTHTAQQALQLLTDSGFTAAQVRKIIFTQPTVFQLKVDSQLKPKIEFIKALGFTANEVAHILSQAPGILCCSLDQNLNPKIPLLVNLFGSKLNLSKALMWNPRLLFYKVDNRMKLKIDILKQSRIQGELLLSLITRRPFLVLFNSEEALKLKIEYVRNMGMLEGSKKFADALAAVDCCGVENIEYKLNHMASIGLLEDEIMQLLKKRPCTLSISSDKMQKNMDFLKHTAGFQPNTLVMYPRLLSYSVENRMQPRHKVIEFLRETEPFRLTTKLAYVYDISEKKFAEKFLMGSPEAAKLYENYKGKSVDLAIS